MQKIPKFKSCCGRAHWYDAKKFVPSTIRNVAVKIVYTNKEFPKEDADFIKREKYTGYYSNKGKFWMVIGFNYYDVDVIKWTEMP